MNNIEDLIDKKFGMLTVLQHTGKNKTEKVLCKCDCGVCIHVRKDYLLNGHTKSCGCLRILNGKSNKKYNKYILGDYGIGYTLNNEPFYFDLEDYNKIKDYCWLYRKSHGNTYVCSKKLNSRKIIQMHRLILGINDPKIGIDHENHFGYDNRKNNLRVATDKQNNYNKNSKYSKYGIIGISFYRNKWRARLKKDSFIYNEYFDSFDDAVYARLIKEKECFGEFAPQKHLFEKYGINI